MSSEITNSNTPPKLRLCYVLLSPTFGMHQYTADYANRMAAAGHEVHLVTTSTYPADRYAPEITVHTPITTHNTGFSPAGLKSARPAIRSVLQTLQQRDPMLVHFTGPHLWNPWLLHQLRRAGVPTIHTLHDLDPHPGAAYGPLLYLWNRLVLSQAKMILVHGQCYQKRLLHQGIPAEKIFQFPLMHLFLSHKLTQIAISEAGPAVRPDRPVTALFFGRLEKYKGIATLLQAWTQLKAQGLPGQLILAGQGDLTQLWAHPLPPDVELRNYRIEDAEALTLFQECDLMVLPYTGATQSALIPAAYYFAKPVIVTRSGALPEYVEAGQTGWVIPPKDAGALCAALIEGLSNPTRLQYYGRNGKLWYNKEHAKEETLLLQLYWDAATR